MRFMHEGGVMTWVVLAVTVGAGALAFARRRETGWRVALQGAVLCLVVGMVGVSAGLTATARAVGSAEQFGMAPAQVLALGIDESVNNSLLGAMCALALLVLSGVLAPRRGVVE